MRSFLIAFGVTLAFVSIALLLGAAAVWAHVAKDEVRQFFDG